METISKLLDYLDHLGNNTGSRNRQRAALLPDLLKRLRVAGLPIEGGQGGHGLDQL